jgi:quercetin dioxygenase-like cupin family protein
MPEASDYFGAPVGTPTEPGRFVRIDELEAYELAAGLLTRPLLGAGVMASFARYEPNSEAPLHAHVEEQLFVVLDGQFEVELNGELRTMTILDAAVIAPWVPHRVVAGPEGGYQLDIFCPPRQGLLDLIAARGDDEPD